MIYIVSDDLKHHLYADAIFEEKDSFLYSLQIDKNYKSKWLIDYNDELYIIGIYKECDIKTSCNINEYSSFITVKFDFGWDKAIDLKKGKQIIREINIKEILK